MGCKIVQKTSISVELLCSNDVDHKSAWQYAVGLQPDTKETAYCSVFHTDWLKDQCRFNRIFWNSHTLTEGYFEAMSDADKSIEASIKESSSFLKVAVGSAMGFLRFTGAIPLGLTEWAMAVADKIPNGPASVAYEIIAQPISSFFYGCEYVFSGFESLFNGGLSEKDSYDAASGITSTVATALFLVMGVKAIAKGTGNFISGLKSGGDLKVLLTPSGAAAFVSGVSRPIIVRGGGNFFTGAIFMSSIGNGDDDLQEDPAKETLFERVKKALTAKKQDKSLQNEAWIADRLEAAGYNLRVVAGELECREETLRLMLYRAKPGSPLFKARGRYFSSPAKETPINKTSEIAGEVKPEPQPVPPKKSGVDSVEPAKIKDISKQRKGGGRRGGRKPTVSTERLLEALRRHEGNRTRAGREVGLSQSTVSTRIKKDPLLAEFKDQKGKGGAKGRRKSRVSVELLLKALEQYEGNRIRAGRKVGLSQSTVSKRIKKDPRLAKFKDIKGKSGVKLKVSMEDLLEALERHEGSRTRAGNDVGLSRPAVSKRIKKDASLAKFKDKKGKGGGRGKRRKEPKVSTECLLEALKLRKGNKKLAGQDVGLSESQVYKRVKKDPILEEFRAKKGK